MFKDGVAYLQAGGGIVFDSVEEDEYVETINKLGANIRALEAAEGKFSFASVGYLWLTWGVEDITTRYKTTRRMQIKKGNTLCL